MNPEVGAITIKRPVGFVGMNGTLTAADLLGNVIDHGSRLLGKLRFKSNERRRTEADTEQLFDGPGSQR